MASIMRCAPVALRFRKAPDRLRDVSIDVSRITHANPLCTWASVAVDQAVVALLSGATIPEAIERSSIGIDHLDVLSAIERPGTSRREQIESGGYVLDTLSAAYWSMLHSATFEEAVVTSVSLGGDTDTTAAVTGALAGAHYGLQAIPDRWRSQVQYRDELTQLALDLLKLSQS